MPSTLGVPGSHNINALWTWGAAANGKLGNGTTTPDVTSPALIGSDTDWEIVSSVNTYSLGIRNGKLYAWGSNANYRTGLNTNSGDTTTPTQVGTDTGWTDAVCGGACGYGIRDGKLYSWGSNLNYRTAQGTNTGETTVPTQVGSDTDWLRVGAGSSVIFAIKTNGKLYSCGNNIDYHSAQGVNTGDTAALTQVGSDTDWELVEGGIETSTQLAAVGIKGGMPVSWGDNANGGTGQNTTSGTTTTPTALSGFSAVTDWTAAAYGSSSGAGIGGGKLYTWGFNNSFRTGQGTSTGTTNTATQIGSNTDWTSVGQSNLFGVAIRSNQAFSWGLNSAGRTGQGTTSGTTNSPTQIGTDRDWKKISTLPINAAHTTAIKG